MTDKLIAYCPDVRIINDPKTHYSFLDDEERAIIIAAALTRKIKEKGEWKRFLSFAFYHGSCETNSPMGVMSDPEMDGEGMFYDEDFIAWLFDPETFIRVAGEWVKTKEGL